MTQEKPAKKPKPGIYKPHIRIMKQEPYATNGATLQLHILFHDTPFGRALIASTDQGICHLSFDDSKYAALQNIRQRFPHANIESGEPKDHATAMGCFSGDPKALADVHLHIEATAFQETVWKALCDIAVGELATYRDIATAIGRPTASRAIGGAIGKNDIAFLIPCHRIIGSDGRMTGYRWGMQRKKLMIEWEASRSRLN